MSLVKLTFLIVFIVRACLQEKIDKNQVYELFILKLVLWSRPDHFWVPCRN